MEASSVGYQSGSVRRAGALGPLAARAALRGAPAGPGLPARRTSRPALAVLLLLAAAACARSERPAAAPTGRAAALVAGRPVPVEWVAAAAGQSGGDLDAGLRRAVEVATLGRLARDRGADRTRWFERERRGLLVRRLLRREVAIQDPPSPRDLEELRATYERIRNWFVRPEIRTVEHLVIVLANPPAGQAAAEPPAWEAARRAVEALAQLARGAESVEAFQALRPLLEDRLRREWTAAGLDAARLPSVRLERIDPFDRHGPYDEAFLAASFALPAAGTVSEPVRSEFGWHLLYLVEALPARDAAFEEALPELLERGGPPLEARRAETLGVEARRRHAVRARPELLPLTMGGPGEARP